MQKSHTCDMCGPILKGILHLAGRQGPSPGHQSYPCKSYGRAFWFSDLDGILRQQSGETFPRMEKGPASSVKSCRCHMLKKDCTCREGKEDFLGSSGLGQHHATHI